ncbi:MAG: glycosyltransferase family 2 protein [Pseudomonadota bacterium]
MRLPALDERFRAFKHGRRLRRAKEELAARRIAPQPHGLETELVVSLTSFPPRFGTLHLTLACLLRQTVRPDGVLLWIAEADLPRLPPPVRALEAEGLEIRSCEDRRSYKKLLFTLEERPGATTVTADDDVYYPADWLERLVGAHARSGAAVVSGRAHRIRRDAAGRPLPYAEWDMNIGASEAAADVFPTGVSGILYAPGCFDPRVLDWERARRLCPTADDVWFHWMYRLAGRTAENLASGTRILEWERDPAHGLRQVNSGGGNDRAIAAMIAEFGSLGPQR